jgi:hypothetical protein
MDQSLGRTIHIHVTVIFDWKMMGVIVGAYLFRLLTK